MARRFIAVVVVGLAAFLDVSAAFHHVANAADATRSVIGQRVDDFALKDFRGREHRLSEYSGSPVVVLAFLGTECPLAKLYGGRLADLQKQFKDRDVTVLGINANRQDSLTEIAAYARNHGIEFPLLKDAGNVVADRVGASRTPEIMVLDQDRIVRYHGRIDDQYGVGYVRDAAQKHFVRDAVEDLLAKRAVAKSQTEIVGCFIGKVRPTKNDSPVTYSNQIARILQNHCVECHRDGEIAPFTLTSYDDVLGWGDTMLEVIADQRMPPWHANPEYGHFSNARALTSLEKEQLKVWVDAGCPEGDASQLPEPRTFTVGWQLPKEPDLVISMRDEPFDVPAEGAVKYQYFQVDPKLTEDRWVTSAELIPGNRAVVHHILAFVRPPNGKLRSGLDGTIGEFFAAYVPGYRMPVYPQGSAKLIPAGSQIVFQLHYTPIGTPQQDISKLGIVFADPQTVEKVVVTQNAANRGGLRIPPHDDNFKVEARSRKAPMDVELLAFMPHMHLRGKSFRYEAHFADGKKEILLDVPHYDFNWQTAYQLEKPLTMPAGSSLQCVAHFDNSENNLNNPDPTATVTWGDQTWNEMMIGYFDVAIPVEAFGLKPGQPKTTQTSTASAKAANQNQARRLAILLTAVGKLDTNKDGRLELREVPAQYHALFKLLDGNNDSVLTIDEARESASKYRGN
jgi:peroxiredoxin